MDKSALEQSIREDAARAIEALKAEQDHEIAELDRVFAEETAAFRERTEAESARHLEWERSRIENRRLLESRKLRLKMLDELVTECAEEAMAGARKDRRYRDYLLHFIGQALDRVAGSGVVLYLGEEDRALEEEVRKILAEAAQGRSWELRKDATLCGSGGAIVEDGEAGVIFNGTLERVYFRKVPDIRRKAMEVLKRHGWVD